MGPKVVAAEGPESVSTELAGPVPAPTHSLPVGSPPSSGSHGVSGSAQTCQGPEMKMRETARHSGEGAIFFGGSTACDAAFV